MTKQEILDLHQKAIHMRRKNRAKNYNIQSGAFVTEISLERDKALERQISIFGQIHNTRISAKAHRALQHAI